jgi:hypothetical protein
MRHKASSSDYSKNAADEMLGKLYAQAKTQFGDAIRSYWFYNGDLCPACSQRSVGVIKFNDKNALSVNAFIYRERGVLIGYLLCETCAVRIFQDAQKNPYTQTPLHAAIERNLRFAYLSFITNTDA